MESGTTHLVNVTKRKEKTMKDANSPFSVEYVVMRIVGLVYSADVSMLYSSSFGPE